MNLEHLIKLTVLNWNNVTNKEKVLLVIKSQLKLLSIKKNKLKLGKIVFEIKELIYAEIPITESLEIRYSRQDNTESDELKLENRLNALKWKWDFYNIGAFFILSLIVLNVLNYLFNSWMLTNMPTFIIREEKFDSLIKFTFNFLKTSSTAINAPSAIKKINFFLFETIQDYVLKKDLFF